MELSAKQDRRRERHLFRQDLQGFVPLAREPERQGVEAWFKAQADLTDTSSARFPRATRSPERMELDKLKPASYSQISYEHGRVFYKKTLGGENVGKLYFRDGWKGDERLLFDPSGFAPKGAKPGDVTTIVSYAPSPDGRYVVLGLSAAGAEFSELRGLDVDSRSLLPDSIYPSYGPLSWTMDSKSFLYDAGKVTDIKSLEIELNRKTRLHTLGTDVSADADFFSNESYPDLGIAAKEMPQAFIDESYPDYVVGSVGTVQNEMRLYYTPTSLMKTAGKLRWAVLATAADNLVRGLVFYKGHVYAVTHSGAPKYKIVRTNVTDPDWKRADTVLPEAKDSIQYITKSKSFLFAVYSDGVVGRLVKYAFDTGTSEEVTLPASGTVDINCPDFRTNQCIVYTTSWIQPTTLYDFDAEKGTFAKSIFNTDVSYPGFDKLVTEEVEVPGHDGTMIPLSIIHRKDLKLDGSSSAILEGYGAYGISCYAVFQRAPLYRAARRRACVRARPRWQRKGRGLVQGRLQDDEAEHLERLHLVRGVPHQEGLHERRQAGRDRHERRRNPHQPRASPSGRTFSPRPSATSAWRTRCASSSVRTDRSTRPSSAPSRMRRRPRLSTKWTVSSTSNPASKYPAVLGVAGWNDPRVAPWQPGKLVAAHAGGEHVREAGAAEGQLRQRPLHRGEDRHVQKLRRPVRVHALADGPQGVPASELDSRRGPRADCSLICSINCAAEELRRQQGPHRCGPAIHETVVTGPPLPSVLAGALAADCATPARSCAGSVASARFVNVAFPTTVRAALRARCRSRTLRRTARRPRSSPSVPRGQNSSKQTTHARRRPALGGKRTLRAGPL